MRIYLTTLLIFLIGISSVHSQDDVQELGIENTDIIASQSLVDALQNRIPGARKITDRYGNKNLMLRGRQSFKTAGDEVLWDIDGIRYSNPPVLNINQVRYVEVLKGLAATNKYGSEGAGGVIVVKTNVNPDQINSGKNILRPKKAMVKKKKKEKEKKKKKKKVLNFLKLKKIVFYTLYCFLLLGCNPDIRNNKNVSDLERLQLKTSFVDLSENKLDLSAYKEEKIVINYWATWCRPCIKEMPSLKKAEEILEDYGYTFLLVSDETISKISKFKNERNFDFNFLKSIKSFETLGIYSMPTSYIFDENGKIIETIVGAIEWDSEEMINKLKIL